MTDSKIYGPINIITAKQYPISKDENIQLFFSEMDLVKQIRRRSIHYTNAKDLSRLEVMEATEVVELK